MGTGKPLLFVFAALAVIRLGRKLAGVGKDSLVYTGAPRVVVYVIGVVASYWLIERSLGMFPAFS